MTTAPKSMYTHSNLASILVVGIDEKDGEL
jgi:hypothetical protein